MGTHQDHPEQPFQPQNITQRVNQTTGSMCVTWRVDGKKLKSNDKVAVSPIFDLFDGFGNYKLMMYPKVPPNGKGGFRAAKGMGIIQLKCEVPGEGMESRTLTYTLSACSGRDEKPRPLAPKGPVTCIISQSCVSGLPKEDETWNFTEAVDEQSGTFVVRLDVQSPQPQYQ